MLDKENEILKRQTSKRIKFTQPDKLFFIILNKAGDIRKLITIVKPETLLNWQRLLIKHFWTFKHKNPVGRKPVSNELKLLILDMKNDNLFWGVRKIQGELIKLGIELDHITIWRIIQTFRKQGKVKKTLSWSKFLKMHINSIYAMDFFTVDTVAKARYYVFFVISHKTREIVHWAVTKNPVKEFVRQQMIRLVDKMDGPIYLVLWKNSIVL